MQNDINIKNKRASFNYEFLEEYTAGIVLTGTEIKSIRAGKASLVDAYCYFHNGELWVKGMYVAEYKLGTYYNHIERRDRKLLLQHKELVKLERKTKESGLTIVPFRLFLNRQTTHRPRPRKERIRQTGNPQTKRRQTGNGSLHEEIIITRNVSSPIPRQLKSSKMYLLYQVLT